MSARRLAAALGLFTIASWPASAVGAGAGAGMLKAKDTGLTVISKPHVATVVAIDAVQPGTCQPGPTTEREGRVVSFAAQPDDPTTGARLNEIVFDFSSEAEAEAFFAELRSSESQRADCPSTVKATSFVLTKGPKGVGDDRFTVTSDERIGGVVHPVTSVELLDGTHVAELVFIDWTEDLPSVTKVATKAAARL